MSYEDFVERKAEEFSDIIDSSLAKLETPVKAPRGALGKVDIEIHHVDTGRYGAKKETQIFALDLLALILAPIAVIIPFFRPEWQIAYAFAAVLLFSVFTRSIVLRLAAICFTTLYFIFGTYLDLSNVVLIVFGINTITLGPIVVTILMTALVAGAGIIHGLSGSTRHAGIWILGLGFLMAILDALIGYFSGGITDWLGLFLVHGVVYLSAFTISWGLFFLVARLVRLGILAASPKRGA